MQRFSSVLASFAHLFVWSMEYTHTYIHSISLDCIHTFVIICFLTLPMKSTYKNPFPCKKCAYISYIYFYLPESIFNARRATTPTSTGSKPMLLGLEIIILLTIAINANFSSHTLSNWHNVTCEL